MKKHTYAILLAAAAFACLAQPAAAQDKPWHALGRTATPAEVAAWDIDVRGDFKGLPKGQGSVSKGEQVWEGKCASCHGTFAESNEVFTPLVGGTTPDDIKSGRVAALAKGGVPQRTTLMKLSKVSTLWDYVNRAMPWNAPKTLSTDEVYAVVAYILNLGAVVPEDFTLSDKNIAEVQKKLPNRNGLRRLDGMWETKGKPDTANAACMKNCATDPVIASFLPDFARNAHGNLAEQNRLIGAARGADTTRPAPAAIEGGAAAARAAPPAAKATPDVPDVKQLLAKNSCTACHGVSNKIIGPAFRDVAARYKDKAEAASYLLAKMKNGGTGVWGAMAMPPQGQLNDADAKVIAHWLVAGAN